MADIKSSLEIALERAAAMGGGGREEIDREEGTKRGQATARKILMGDLEPDSLTGELGSLSGEGLAAARKAAGQILLEAVPQAPRRALGALESLVGQGRGVESLMRLAAAVAALQKADAELLKELTLEMAGDLAEAGISGSAVRPNPAAHPDYKKRRQAALADGFKSYNAAAGRLAEALELG